MFLYVGSIVLIVASNTFYNICQKSTPQNANPFAALLVTYLTAAFVSLVAFPFYKTNSGSLETLQELNWTSIALGFAVVGLELGYLLAYRSGWNISMGSLVANIILSIILIPVGVIFYYEGFGVNKIAGVLFCLVGLVLLNKKPKTEQEKSGAN